LTRLFWTRAKLSLARIPTDVIVPHPPLIAFCSTIVPSWTSQTPMTLLPALPVTTLEATRAHPCPLQAIPAEVVGPAALEPWMLALPSTAHRLAWPALSLSHEAPAG